MRPTCPRESKDPAGSAGSTYRRGLASAAAFAQGRGLADPLAQEVQLGAADLAVADDFDLLDARAVDLEGALDPDAGRDPPDGDGASDPAAAQPHDGSLEHLDALAVALDDLRRDLHGVTRGEFRQVGAELVLDDLVEHVHAAFLGQVGQPKLQVGRLEGPRNRRPVREYSTGSRSDRSGAPYA